MARSKTEYGCPNCDYRVVRCTDTGVALTLLCSECGNELEVVGERRVEYDGLTMTHKFSE